MMKNTHSQLWIQDRTNPLLLKAQFVLSEYSKSTGTVFNIMDANLLSIPEHFEAAIKEKNTCLYCMKHRLNVEVTENQDFVRHPCRELHINAMKKACLSGGSFIYKCDLGFVFWASPIYWGHRFIGASIGSGVLDNDKQETAEKMILLGAGKVNEEEITKRLEHFPRVDTEHVKALAELMQVCAESLSRDSGDHHETLKRRGIQEREVLAELKKFKEKNDSPDHSSEYPLDKEKAFLEAVSAGETTKARRLLNELLGQLLFTHPDEFKFIQYWAMELTVLLSRMENTTTGRTNVFSSITHQFLKPLEEAENQEELIDILHLMTLHLSRQAFSFQGIRHFSALKRADLFIQKNFSRKLSLDEIASASGLSAPYFSTIFKKEMGENLSSYLNRLRVEKANRLLAETDLSLGKIADSCGFEDQSWFSKIYKTYTGISPGKYRQKKKTPVPDIPASDLSEDYLALIHQDELSLKKENS